MYDSDKKIMDSEERTGRQTDIREMDTDRYRRKDTTE